MQDERLLAIKFAVVLTVSLAVPAAAFGTVGLDGGPGVGLGDTVQAVDAPPATESGQDAEFDSWFYTVERCGFTCRTVRGGVVNAGDEPRHDVTATVQVSVGDDVVWSDTLSFGTLAVGEGDERMRTVEVGLAEAARIKLNGGRVTVTTVVEWDDGRTVYERTVTVA